MRNESIYSGQTWQSVLPILLGTHPINSLDVEQSPREGSHHEQLSAWDGNHEKLRLKHLQN